METLFLLVPVALLFAGLAIKFLFWAIKSGQYDDLNTEGHRILFDEDETQVKNSSGAAPQTTKTESVAESAHDVSDNLNLEKDSVLENSSKKDKHSDA